jgi:AcrR family transcriptional regulator
MFQNFLRVLGFSRKHTPRRVRTDPQLENEIISLYEDGLTMREIAAELGVSTKVVFNVLKRKKRNPRESKDEVEILQEAAERIRAAKQVLKAIGEAERFEEMGTLERIAYALGVGLGQALSAQLQQAAQAGFGGNIPAPQTPPIQAVPAPSPPPATTPSPRPAPTPTPAPAPAETRPSPPTLKDVLDHFKKASPDEAARYLLHLAAAYPEEWAAGIQMLRQLPESHLDAYLDALAKQGGDDGRELSAWLRQHRNWTLTFLRVIKASA